MAKFIQYVHREFQEWYDYEDILNQCGVEIPAEVLDDPYRTDWAMDWMEKIGEPFYELRLECDLDLETGKVTILGIK